MLFSHGPSYDHNLQAVDTYRCSVWVSIASEHCCECCQIWHQGTSGAYECYRSSSVSLPLLLVIQMCILRFNGPRIHNIEEGHRHESQQRHDRIAGWQKRSLSAILQHLCITNDVLSIDSCSNPMCCTLTRPWHTHTSQETRQYQALPRTLPMYRLRSVFTHKLSTRK